MQIEQALNSGNSHLPKPSKALDNAFLKVKPNRTQDEGFKENLIKLLDRTKDTESEDFHKDLVINFRKKTYYEAQHFIRPKGSNHLWIYNCKEPDFGQKGELKSILYPPGSDQVPTKFRPSTDQVPQNLCRSSKSVKSNGRGKQ